MSRGHSRSKRRPFPGPDCAILRKTSGGIRHELALGFDPRRGGDEGTSIYNRSNPRPPSAGREMGAHPARRELGSTTPAAGHLPPRRTSPLGFRGSAHRVGEGRPFRAESEVSSHLIPGEFGAASPAAFHPGPSGAPDEVECRIALKPAPCLRHPR